MRSLSIQQLSLCLLCVQNDFALINSFTPTSRPQISLQYSSTSLGNNRKTFLKMSSKEKTDGGEDGNVESGMSFEDATDALREQEEKERQATRGAMFEEVGCIH